MAAPLFTLLLLAATCSLAAAAAATPALFAFGDSLVDAGNNNVLLTRARANHLPYGINFLNGNPTGRWCDGRLIVDFLAEELELPLPKPYVYATQQDIVHGANFASASTGILDTTAIDEAQPLGIQVSNFARVARRLEKLLGRPRKDKLISSSIFYIQIANNDVNNYYQIHHTSNMSFIDQFQILNTFRNHMEDLYYLGARKFVIVGLSAVGCVPINQRNGTCAEAAQTLASSYNQALDTLLSIMRSYLPQATFVQTRFFELMVEVKTNPEAFGISNSNLGCCPLDTPSIACFPTTPRCTDPSEYMFFDGVHLTETFNKVAIQRWWNGTHKDVFPINIQQLAAIG